MEKHTMSELETQDVTMDQAIDGLLKNAETDKEPEKDPDERGALGDQPETEVVEAEPDTESEEVDIVGDEESEDPDDGIVEQEEDVFEIEGAEIPVSELIEGYKLNKDSRLKAEKLEADRRELENARQTTHAERGENIKALKEAIANLETSAKQHEPDWVKLAEENPVEYGVIRAKWDAEQVELAKKHAEAQTLLNQEQKKFWDEERAKLPAIIKEWSDPKTAEAEKAAILTYATTELGYTPEQMNGAAAKDIAVLRKAYLYDKLQEAKPAVVKKVRKARRGVMKPGATMTKGEQKAEQADALRNNLIQNGSVDAAVEHLLMKQ